MVSKRRKMREAIIETIFQLDFQKDITLDDLYETFKWISKAKKLSLRLELEAKEYIKKIFENKSRYDNLISKFLLNWDFERIASVERSVMRLAIYELEEKQDIPAKVILDEAIELAKYYSEDEAGKFVNGILDRIAKEVYNRLKEEDLNGKGGNVI